VVRPAPAVVRPAPAVVRPARAEPAVASDFDVLPGWTDDALAEALPAWRRTCERLARAPSAQAVGPDGVYGTVGDWRALCVDVPRSDLDHAAARRYFEAAFVPVALTDHGEPTGLFTGYYEPSLRGSRRPSARHRVPLFARPRDLVDGPRGPGRRVGGRWRPYWSRAEIARGALRRSGRPLVWVDDPVDAFFLEIQGSGRVLFDDGSSASVHYAASNGHPYVAIGRVLVARGALAREAVSLQSIRAWLVAHPREAPAVMNANPSYVFFRLSDDVGAHGAEGVTLTPGRSLAVDRRFVPLGVPLFVDIAPLADDRPIRRLVVAQDTGGAIRGAVRGDLFWGAGPEAYDRAGRMRQRGRYWLLAPRAVARRLAP